MSLFFRLKKSAIALGVIFITACTVQSPMGTKFSDARSQKKFELVVEAVLENEVKIDQLRSWISEGIAHFQERYFPLS